MIEFSREKLGRSESGDAIAAYNEKLNRRAALDTPGSDAYFKAVHAESLLAVESRRRTRDDDKPPKSMKLKVVKSSRPTPQRCAQCDVMQEPGVKVWAHPNGPIVFCVPCKTKSGKNTVGSFSAMYNKVELVLTEIALFVRG